MQKITLCLWFDGVAFQALNGGRDAPFTEAISLSVSAGTKEEIDELWEALTADGGEPSQCGWLKDKFGLSWQVEAAYGGWQ